MIAIFNNIIHPKNGMASRRPLFLLFYRIKINFQRLIRIQKQKKNSEMKNLQIIIINSTFPLEKQE